MRPPTTTLVAALLLAACADGGDSRPLRVYRVGPVDTLTTIAERFRLPGGVGTIARANGLSDPDLIRNGVGLLLPDGPTTAHLPLYQPPLPAGDAFRPCAAARPWPAPVEAPREGCERAACTARGDESVCLCVGSDDGEDGFRLSRRGEEVGRLDDLPFMGDLRGFDVTDADLDGDGEPEVVLATREAVSNGIAIELWSLALFDSLDAPPTRLSIEELGEGTFLERPGGSACDLLVTEWVALEDQLRGVGTYLAGRRWRIEGGELRPAGEAVVRRLTEGFLRTRDVLADAERWAYAPAEALGAPAATGWPADPAADGGRLTVGTGRIEGVRLDPEGRPVFSARLEDGRLVELVHLSTVDLGADATATWTRIGEAVPGVVYPEGYLPRGGGAAFVGRAFRLAVHERTWGEPARVLWLEGPVGPRRS